VLGSSEKEPRISQGQGMNGSGLAEGAWRKKRGSTGAVRFWALSQYRRDLLPNGLGSGWGKLKMA